MMIEALALLASWHPGHEDDYNAVTPGLIITAGMERDPREIFAGYITAGAYVDSYKKPTALVGLGFDVGYDYGVGLTVARVTGSDMQDFPVTLIPSVFYRHGDYGARLICAPDVIAVAFTYTLKR